MKRLLVLLLFVALYIQCQEKTEPSVESCQYGYELIKQLEIGNRNYAMALLKEKNAHTNIKNDSGRTALFTAVQNNDPELVRLLLEYGADSNFVYNEQTPLIFALEQIYKKNEKFVDLALILINHEQTDVDLHSKYHNNDGCFPNIYPIQLAALTDTPELIKALLERGAKTNNNFRFDLPKDHYCKYCLQLKKKCRGYDSDYLRSKLKAKEEFLKFHECSELKPALEIACKKNNIDNITLLLKKGATPNTNCLKWSILHKSSEMLELLLKYDKTECCKHKTNEYRLAGRWTDGPTMTTMIVLEHVEAKVPLLYYAITENFGFDALTKSGASLNKRVKFKTNFTLDHYNRCDQFNHNSFTPLMTAAYLKKSAFVERLIAEGADPTLTTLDTLYTAHQLAKGAGDHQKLFEAALRWNRGHQAASSSSVEELDASNKDSEYTQLLEETKKQWEK